MRRCDIEAATPRCWRKLVPKNPGVLSARTGGWHGTCLKPMSYRAQDNTWVCPACGNEDSGLLVAARLTVIEVAA
jgi:hypothetical protein